MVLDHFLGASRSALFADEAEACELAGSMTSVEDAIALLLMDRHLLMHPKGGIGGTPGIHLLGRREREVLGLLSKGLSNPEIAAILDVKEGTVKKQVHTLRTKLRCSSRVLLMQAGQRLLQPGSTIALPESR